jgi:hypothetical protein
VVQLSTVIARRDPVCSSSSTDALSPPNASRPKLTAFPVM